MNPLILGPVLQVGKSLLDRFIPDPAQKAAAELEFIKMAAEGELKQVVAQLEINAKEAGHTSVWVAGWRPGFGWCGCVGFFYATVAQPLLAWLSRIKGWPEPPVLDTDLLMVVVSGMLCIGGYRTFEKLRKVAK